MSTWSRASLSFHTHFPLAIVLKTRNDNNLQKHNQIKPSVGVSYRRRRIMEPDLPLIEISGEDDSLLQLIPTLNDATNLNNDHFSVSPLQVPISKGSTDSPRVSFTSQFPLIRLLGFFFCVCVSNLVNFYSISVTES